MSDIFWVMFEIVINVFQGMICAYFVKEFLGKKEERLTIKNDCVCCELSGADCGL